MEEAGSKRGGRARFSLAWVIPAIAVVATALMIWDNTFNEGPLIKVTLRSAEGIKAGATEIRYRSFPVGRVESLELADDLKSVTAWVRMDPDTEPLLAEDSKIWVVRARLEASAVTGLDTILGGAYLQVALGGSDKAGTEFVALDDPPVNPYNEKGTIVDIYSEGKNRVIEGSTVTYKGINAGHVFSVRLDPGGKRVNYRVFIKEPYDSLLRGNTYFWTESGIGMSFDGRGFKMNVDSMVSILEGSLAFGNLGYRGSEAALDLSKPQPLHENLAAAEVAALDGTLKLVVLTDQRGDGLRVGSRVYHRGVEVGRVIDPVMWNYDEDYKILTNTDAIPVVISIYTESLEEEETVRKMIVSYVNDEALCAYPYSESLISGYNSIAVEAEEKGQCKCGIKEIKGMPVLPFVSSASPLDSVKEVLADIKGMRLDDTALEARKALVEVQRTLEAMGRTLESMERQDLVHEVTESFRKLSDSLQQFKKTTQDYDQNSKVYKKLVGIMGQLEQAMRDLNPGMRDLGESPRSLIFGPGKDPVPGKRR